MMTSLEHLLRDAMDEHTSSAPPIRTGMAHAALRGSRRTRRLQTAAVSGGSVAAAAVVVAASSLAGNPGSAAGSPGGSGSTVTSGPAPTSAAVAPPPVVAATLTATPGPAPSSAPAPVAVVPTDPAATGGPAAPPGPPVKGAAGPAELDAVTLPDPAPGFPVRRWADRPSTPTGVGGGAGGGRYWTKDFGVAVTPDKVFADGSETPTGPEATILVIDGSPAIDGTVVGHTHVDGAAAVLVDYDHEHGLGFSFGKFEVQVWGSSTVTSDQLVALASALQHLPG